MARRYDRLVRFYSSWFADFFDAEKGFTAEELVAIFRCIFEAQMDANPDHLDTLPASIKRGLSMATMREQLAKIVEKTESRRNASSHGGDAADTLPAPAGTKSAAKDAAQERRKALAAAETARKELEQARAAENNAFYKAAAKACGLDVQKWFAFYDENPQYALKLSLADPKSVGLSFEEWEIFRGLRRA